jgi:hypothetical protein
MTLRFSDGGNIDTSAPLRVLHLAGYYVIGEGMSIPVNSREEAEKIIDERQKRLGSDLDEDDKGASTKTRPFCLGDPAYLPEARTHRRGHTGSTGKEWPPTTMGSGGDRGHRCRRASGLYFS